MTTHYLMLRALGDCVISLGLLEQLPHDAEVRILGSPLASRVAAAIGFARFPVEHVLPDVAAFFDLKHAGLRKALIDVHSLRGTLGRRLQPGDRVLLEHHDWRTPWIVPRRRGVSVVEPPKRISIYQDRHEMLERCFGPMADVLPCVRPAPVLKRLVLNPGARLAYKALSPVIVNNLVEYCESRSIEICLLDPERLHGEFQSRVREYLPAPPLTESINRLCEADLYVGADSFFLHLAYRFRRPSFAIVPHPNAYFAPPGLIALGGTLTIGNAVDKPHLAKAVDAFLS